MYNGSLIITSNPAIINQATYDPQARILTISEDMIPLSNVVSATIFIPPYSVMMLELENRTQEASVEYLNYLSSPGPDSFICTMLRGMMKGFTMIINISGEAIDTRFMSLLSDYLERAYGVFPGIDRVQQFNFVVEAIPPTLNKMYLYDVVSGIEYVNEYPVGVPIPPDVLGKLIHDFNPYIENRSMENYNMYFMDFIKRAHVSQNNVQPAFASI